MNEPARWNPTPESLLSERAWAHRLARRLLRGDGAAEDVAQEACLRALDRPAGRSPRGWLAGIVRNLAREHRRGEGRRTQREALAARPEAEPSASAALERLAIQQDVVRAVLTLAEPYRSTIVLRFYENLPPRKIAARQGVPVATVKSRLLRGLGELRAQLDREHGGDGRSWALFLAPLAARPGGALPFVPELAMGALLKIGLVSAAAIGLVLWLARGEGTPSPAPPLEEPSVASAVLERAPVPAPTTDAREALPASASSSSGTEAVTFAPETIHGRVLDLAGEPVAGVTLTLRESHGTRMDAEGGSRLWSEPSGPLPTVLSDAVGAFAIERPAVFSGAVVSADERVETILCPSAHLHPGQEAVVLVAPRVVLNGLVRDADGNHLAEAEIRLDLPEDIYRRVAADLTESLAVGWAAHSDASGRFTLEVPAVPGAALRTRLAPFEDQWLTRDPWLDEELEIVLTESVGPHVEGVVEVGGLSRAGAKVILGRHAVTTGPDGRFRMPLAGREHATELCALLEGFLPQRVRGDVEQDGNVRWPSFVRLQLGEPCLALSGRVTDAEGRPLAGHEVWLTDGTVSHTDPEGYPVLLESVLAGSTEMRNGATTDDEGRFRIGGLEARAYHMQAVDERTALLVDGGPFSAGREDVVLRYPAGALHPLVQGTVRSRTGEPLGGLGVYVARETGFVTLDDQAYGFEVMGARDDTDEQGRFELSDVPRSGVTLFVVGGGTTGLEFELGPGIDPLTLDLVVGARMRLQVGTSGALARAERFVCLDVEGNVVSLETAMEGGTRIRGDQQIVAGRSTVVSLGDEAKTLVLYVGDEELARVPLTLRVGELNRVDL